MKTKHKSYPSLNRDFFRKKTADVCKHPKIRLFCINILKSCFLVLSASGAPSIAEAGGTTSAYLAAIYLPSTTTPVTPLLNGSSIEWPNNGDNILSINGNAESFAQPALGNLQTQKISVLRYPGGSLSDLYHWQDGIGPLSSRGYDLNYNGQAQQVLMGTQEFLELCEALNAEPLITVNVMTGTASEAAAWVSYVNKQNLISSKTGNVLPKVKYWEIGNEPYYADLFYPAMTPNAYATQAAAYIAAMKAVDPTIQTGITLTTTTQNWNSTVLSNLANLNPSFDYAAVHVAYLPYCTNTSITYQDSDLYALSMTSMPTVLGRLQNIKASLNTYFPRQHIPMALTEHSVDFGTSIPQASYIATLDGALYTADLLSLLAVNSGVTLANHWAASNGWYFGGLNANGQPQPVYYTLSNFARITQQGYSAPISINASPTLGNPSLCSLPSQIGLPAMSGYGVYDNTNNILHVMLLNKHPDYSAVSVIMTAGSSYPAITGNVNYTLLTSAGYFDTSITPQTGSFSPSNPSYVVYTIPPHSVVFLDIPFS